MVEHRNTPYSVTKREREREGEGEREGAGARKTNKTPAKNGTNLKPPLRAPFLVIGTIASFLSTVE